MEVTQERKTELLQRAFNIAAPHLLKQMAKSEDDLGTCMYRGNNECMCALGPIISNDQYDKAMERLSPQSKADDEDEKFIVRQARIDKLHAALAHGLKCDPNEITAIASDLGFLQSVHDQFKPREWHKQLEIYAQCNELNTACMPSA